MGYRPVKTTAAIEAELAGLEENTGTMAFRQNCLNFGTHWTTAFCGSFRIPSANTFQSVRVLADAEETGDRRNGGRSLLHFGGQFSLFQLFRRDSSHLFNFSGGDSSHLFAFREGTVLTFCISQPVKTGEQFCINFFRFMNKQLYSRQLHDFIQQLLRQLFHIYVQFSIK